MSDTEIVVSADNLGKRFKLYPTPGKRLAEWLSCGARQYHTDFWALRNISFEVKKGECFGIIGQNGAGKSTLLKILSGAMSLTEGTYLAKGRTLSLLELGAGFNLELTGRQNVYNSASLLGFPKGYLTKERMADIKKFADIDNFFDQPVKLYSSGMFVRLAFAMFIFMEPDIFIIDEALSVGDVFFQQKCFSKIRELLDKGITILFVSHDLQAVQNLSGNVLLLANGKACNIGKPEAMVAEYYGMINKGDSAKPSATRSVQPQGIKKRNIDTGKTIIDPEKIMAHSVLNGKNRISHGGASLLAATVMDENNTPTLSFSLMNNARFYLLIEPERRVTDPHVGIAIYDRMNNLVFACTTKHLGVTIPDMKPGHKISIGFEVGLNIQPGQYTFSLTVGEPGEPSSPNAGRICDRHNDLGPISVVFDYKTMVPFNGIAQLPMTVIK